MNSICRSLVYSIAATFLSLASVAGAATFGWSGSGSGPGSGAGTPWLTVGNWTNNASTPTNTDIAFFGAGGSATAIGFSLSAAPQNSTNLGAIVLGTGSTIDRTIGNSATVAGALSNIFLYGVGGGLLTNEVAGRTLTIAPFAQGGTTVPLALRLMNSGIIHSVGSINIISHIAEAGGSRGFTKTGSGTLTLSTNNSFTGKVIVNGGAVAIADENRLGNNPGAATADQLTLDGGILQATANVTIDDGNRGITLGAAHGTFSANNGTTLTVSRPIVGSGNLTNSGAGTLILNAANSYSGRTVLRAGIARPIAGSSFGALPGAYVADRIILDGGGILNQDVEFTLEANRGITLGAGGGRLQAGFSKQWGVNSIIAGSGNLTIAADATPHVVSLNGANTFTGDFIVNNNTSGTWALAAVNGSLAPGGRAIITTNGWLMGSGVINRVLVATNGATLGAGGLDSAGTLTINSNVFLTNALLRLDLANSTSVGSGVNDLLQVNGNLTLSGVITVVPNALQGVLAPGTYRILNYTGSLTGSEVNLTASVPGYGIAFDTSTPGEVNMIVTGTPASLVWKGSVNTNWDVGVTANWEDTGAPSVFQQGAAVLFDDTGFYGPSINLVGPNVGWNSLYPSSVTVDSSSNVVFTSVGSGGKLSGGMTLNKRGPGSLTLNTGNANFPNDYSGPTIVEGGVLNLGYARALGSTNGSTTVSNGATLDLKGFNPTFENFTLAGSGVNNTGAVINTGGALSNNGLRGNVTLAGDVIFGGINRWDVFNGKLFGNGFNLTKTGPPEIALSSLGETGLGDIDILQGQLTFLGNTTMGNPARTLTVSPGATLAYWTPGTNVLNKNLVFNSANVINNSGGVATNAGSVTIHGAASFSHSADIVLTGPIGGLGNITKNAAGQLILTGTNSFSGTNTILAGRLALAGNGSLSNSPVIDVRSGATFDVSRVTGGTWNLAENQTLLGVGSVYGNVVAAAGTIVPGTSPGTLTIQSNLTLSGGTAVFELAAITNIGAGINDLIFVTNNLTFSGTSTLKIVPLAPLNTTQPYALFFYSNVLTGGAGELNVVSDSRYSFTVDTSLPKFVRLTASGTAGNLVWAGGVAGSEELWDLNTTANWLNGATPDVFRSGDVVTFSDGSSYTNISVIGNLSVGGMVVDGTQTYTVDGGRIASAGLVTKNGGGRLLFAADNPEMTGGVLINSGSVEVGEGGVTGTVGTSPITNLATLVLNRADTNTVANVIRGSGTLIKTGSGQLTLSGANAFTGPVVVENGTLRQGAAGAFGQAIALNVESGGQIDLGGVSPTVRSNSYFLAGSGPDGRGALLNTGASVSGNSGISNVTLTADATLGAFGSDGNGRFDLGSGASAPGLFGQFNANEFALTKVGPGAVNHRIPSINFPLLVVSNGLYYGENFDFNLATNIIVYSNASIGMFTGGSFRTNSSALTLHQGATVVNVGGNMTNVWTGPVTNHGAATINVAGPSGNGHIQFLNNLYGSAPYNVIGGNSRNVELYADNDETFSGAWTIAGSTILRAMTNGTFGPGSLTNNGVVEWLNTNETTLAQAITGSGTFRHHRGAGPLILSGSASQGIIILQNGDLSSNVTFASTAVVNANSLSIGTSNAPPNGSAVGSGRLVIEPGAVLRAGSVFLGDQNTQTGQVAQAGGTVIVTNQFRAGHWPNNVSTYTIDDGTFTVLATPPSNPSGTTEQNGALYVGVDGVGIFNQNGGVVSTPALVLDNRGSSVLGLNTNTYNLLGGTLSLGSWGIQSPVSTYQVNLGEGTLAASQSWTSGLRMTLTANVTVNPNGNVITLNGPLSGSGGLVKAGAGTLLLNATNTFTADLNVSEGTVGGNGIVFSYVYVDAAGILAPGTSVGVFTVSNDVQLAGTALMEISRAGQSVTSDRLRVIANTLTLGGTLSVTNIGQPLIGGEVFDLFDWVAVSGAFDVIDLPPLPAHLSWNTANLYVDGTIQVDGPPTITLAPVGQTVYRGDNIFFRAQATNINPFGVRWQKGGLDIPDALGNTLALTNVQLSDAGTYTFIASNAFGESSANATLTVLEVTNLSAGLIAYWPLDAVQDGFTPDATTNGNHLFLTNMTVTNVVAGQRSNALSFFTNVNSLLTRTYIAGNVLPANQYQGYTVAMWVKGPTNQIDRRVFAESSTNNNNPLVNVGTFNSASTNGAVDIFIRTDAGGTALVDHRKSTLQAFNDSWHHIVWVDNNGSAQLYVDGILDSSNFNYARGTLTLNTITLGAIQRTTASAWFQGAIDDVMIWRRALDSNEVVCVMTNSLAGPPVIVTEPASLTVQCSSNATFGVAATSYDLIRYQWHFNGEALPNATNAALTVPGTAANAGSYFVVLTNCAGASTSAVAVLSVTNTPSEISPGGELATATDNNACGSMVLAGESVYRWEIADAGSSAGANWDLLNVNGALDIQASPSKPFVVNVVTLNGGAAGPAANFDNTADYAWTFASASGGITGFDPAAFSLVTSGFNNALPAGGEFRIAQSGNDLQVLYIHTPVIEASPTNALAECGTGSATFAITVSGTGPLSYQWRHAGTNLPGATSATLTVTPTTSTVAGAYDVIVSNAFGFANSAAATLALQDVGSPGTELEFAL